MQTATACIEALRELDTSAFAAIYDAAAEVAASTRELAEHGLNPVTAVLDGAGVVEEWVHYPLPDDIHDPATGAEYYYHAHEAAARAAGEHGHFHTFLRPVHATGSGQRSPDAFTHLIGISMDRHGRPFRLFTTNRWVTGEEWRRADEIIPMLDRFVVDVARPRHALNRWLTAMVRLFRPTIVELIRARDNMLATAPRHDGLDLHEDRALHVISEANIDLVGQIRAIDELARGSSP